MKNKKNLFINKTQAHSNANLKKIFLKCCWVIITEN